jgi:hypothetical protein
VHILVGLFGGALIALMLAEFFVAFMLPRRVKRDPRIARGTYRAIWRPWRALARRLPPDAADTALGFFGPVALLIQLVVWTLGLMLGYACVRWAGHGDFRDESFFSAATFLSASFDPQGTWERVIGLFEAATGVGVLFIVIGYLPSVYGAFSRREVAVSQLAARAGSPPSAGALLRRAAERGGWEELDRYLRDAERWAAELMETHLSYPLLAFYRSQHVGQNWLAALTTIVDTSAVLLAALDDGAADAAEHAFGIGRHALADLAHQSGAKPAPATRVLGDEQLSVLRGALEASGLPLVDDATWRHELEVLRRSYEPKAEALSRELALSLPDWLPDEEARARRKALPAHLR